MAGRRKGLRLGQALVTVGKIVTGDVAVAAETVVSLDEGKVRVSAIGRSVDGDTLVEVASRVVVVRTDRKAADAIGTKV